MNGDDMSGPSLTCLQRKREEVIGFCTMFQEFRACTLGSEAKTIMLLWVLQSFYLPSNPTTNAQFHIINSF